jgi:hypothetical protein
MSGQLNEAELEVDSKRASYKQRLEELQQQEELIEDEGEQEQKEEDARRARREASERQSERRHACPSHCYLTLKYASCAFCYREDWLMKS